MMNLNIFNDPSFRSSSKGCYPNRLYGNAKKIGVIAVLRKPGGKDFALNVAGLEIICNAEAKGELNEAHVMLATKASGDMPVVVAIERAREVQKRLDDIPPYDGKFGPHWWISIDFMPTAVVDDSGLPW